MSQREPDHILQVGYLRSCMDRRFVEATRRKFEEVTGLSSDRYYHEAFAGGALNQVPTPPPNPNPDGADYVYTNPEIRLEVMGWQAHLDHCGGLPGRDNLWITNTFSGVSEQWGVPEQVPTGQACVPAGFRG